MGAQGEKRKRCQEGRQWDWLTPALFGWKILSLSLSLSGMEEMKVLNGWFDERVCGWRHDDDDEPVATGKEKLQEVSSLMLKEFKEFFSSL